MVCLGLMLCGSLVLLRSEQCMVKVLCGLHGRFNYLEWFFTLCMICTRNYIPFCIPDRPIAKKMINIPFYILFESVNQKTPLWGALLRNLWCFISYIWIFFEVLMVCLCVCTVPICFNFLMLSSHLLTGNWKLWPAWKETWGIVSDRLVSICKLWFITAYFGFVFQKPLKNLFFGGIYHDIQIILSHVFNKIWW